MGAGANNLARIPEQDQHDISFKYILRRIKRTPRATILSPVNCIIVLPSEKLSFD